MVCGLEARNTDPRSNFLNRMRSDFPVTRIGLDFLILSLDAETTNSVPLDQSPSVTTFPKSRFETSTET